MALKIMSVKCQSCLCSIGRHTMTPDSPKASNHWDCATPCDTRRHQIGPVTRAGSVGVRGSSPLSSTHETLME